MPLHLIKLCVGVSEIDQLTAWGRRERGKGSPPIVHTRMTPKRVGELLEGGSLYWVIKGVVQARQRIVSIDTLDGDSQRSRCEITLDDAVTPREYNYRRAPDIDRPRPITGEEHAISVFFRVGDDVFHTYSAFARGTEGLTDAFSLLDLTPYGRQQDFEDSPAGFPQKPTYG